MTRCPEFYDKFEKEGNFCGLSPGAISQIKAYNEMREMIGKHIPDKAFVVENFPEFASRVITTHAKDEGTRNMALGYVVACLKRKEKVTAGDLKRSIQGWLKTDGKACSTVARSKKVYERKDETTVSAGTQAEAPDAPIAPILKEKFTPPEHKPPAPPTEVLPCLAGNPCPEGRNYLRNELSTRGRVCDVMNQSIKQMSVCPVIQRQRAAQANCGMFTTAAALIKPSVERAPESLPRVAQNQPRELLIRFTEKQWNVLKQLQREGQADTFEEAVLFLVDEAGARMEGA